MRVMVTGSRDWQEVTIVRMALAEFDMGDNHLTIVHGDALGADRIAARVAEDWGWSTEAHPADWKRHGRAAGPIRNIEMLESGIDHVVAFWKDRSRGTSHAIHEARSRNIDVKAYVVVNGLYANFHTERWTPTTVGEGSR